MKENIYKYIISFLLAIFLVVSVYTYYNGLSQYATADQMEGTYPRIEKFLSNSDSIDFKNGFNFSFITVGIGGKKLDNFLNSKYKLQDSIIGNIYYTRPLPYTLIQVSIALLFLLYLVYLICHLLDIRLDNIAGWLYYLFIATILLNLPMLKGEAKLLKYDALSLIFSLITTATS